MIKIADRYILKRYLFTFFFITISLLFVMTIFNWIDYNDKFTKNHAPASLVLEYYIYMQPYFLNIIVSVCALLAALMSFANLSKFNELIALQAGGVSRMRMIVPVLVAAIFISIGMLAFNEYITVAASSKKDYIFNELVLKKKVMKDTRNRLIQRFRHDGLIYIDTYHTRDTVMTGVIFQYITDDMAFTKRIDADSVIWQNDDWVLKNARIHTHATPDDSVFSFNQYSQYRLADFQLTPADFEMKLFRPGKIDRFNTIPEMLDYAEKLAFFGQPTFIVDYEIYNALFFPFSIFFMTFIGAILGSIHSRRGLMLYFFICLFICLLYIIVIVVGSVLGQNNTISPFLGALLPHLLTASGLIALIAGQ